MFAALNSFLTGALAKVTDVYWPFVSMLLHGDSPQQYNADASTYAFTLSDSNIPINAVASMQTSSNTPFTGGPSSYGSGYFNAAANSGLTIPTNAAFTLGTTATIEMWIYPTATTIQRLTNNGTSGGLDVFIYTGGVVYVNGANGGTTTALTLNAWTHLAVVYNSGTLTIYFNGVSQALTGTTTGYNFTANSTVYIGNSAGNAQFFTGFMSNLRVVKGVAVYTGAFTSPTAALAATQSSGTNISAITGTQTSLLTLQTNVPVNNNSFFDTSTNKFLVTRNGNTTQGSFNPFVSTYPYAVATNGGSAYFDGTGDYLAPPNNAAFSFGSGDFTIECWIKVTSTTAYNIYVNSDSVNNLGVTFYAGSGTIYTYVTAPAGNIVYGMTGPANSVVTDVWTHVAFVRSGSTFTNYVNGVAGTSVTNSNAMPASQTNFYIGAAYNLSSFFSGYMSNYRVVKGTAVYTANFTPPTAPLTAITNTSLLLGFTNGAIYDNAELNNLETVASAQISTSVFKYGTGSVRTGSGNYLSTPMKSQFQFAAGDFTVETWAYVVNNVAEAILLDCALGGSNYGWFLEYSNARGLFFYMGTGSSGGSVAYATTPALTTWTHLAVSRQSGTLRLFINGVLVNSGSLPNSSVATLPLLVGACNGYTTTYYFDGYLDDVRITNGIARYTTTFTPPTAAFPNLGPTYPSGTATQRAMFAFGASSVVLSTTNLVSDTGVVAGDAATVATARQGLAAAGYGGDKAIFAYGYTTGVVSLSNLVSNTGVIAADTTGVGTARYLINAASYGVGKAIFAYGYTSTQVSISNLVSSAGVIATDTTGVGTTRSQLAAASYGTDKAIFAYGWAGPVLSVSNLVSNTGVVGNDVTGVGTARLGPAAAGYGGDKAIFGYGNNSSAVNSPVSMTNLVSNTGVVASDTTGVGTARAYIAAASYGGDKAIFGYGYNGSNLSMSNLVSSTGVVATDTTGVGTARSNNYGVNYSYA